MSTRHSTLRGSSRRQKGRLAGLLNGPLVDDAARNDDVGPIMLSHSRLSDEVLKVYKWSSTTWKKLMIKPLTSSFALLVPKNPPPKAHSHLSSSRQLPLLFSHSLVFSICERSLA